MVEAAEEEAKEEEAKEEAGTPRRDPSEKQEPHTVMWGKINVSMAVSTFSQHHTWAFHTEAGTCVV